MLHCTDIRYNDVRKVPIHVAPFAAKLRRMKIFPALASALAATLTFAVALTACSDGSSREPDPEPTSDEQGVTVGKRAPAPACHDAAVACVATNDACEPLTQGGPRQACCDPKARCMEYTVYDWNRCRIPAAIGEYCYRDEQCASNHCDSQTAGCAP